MKKIFVCSTVAFILLSCIASSPRKSLQSRLYGFWAPSGIDVTVLEIDKDSFYYVDEDPIVALPYKFAGDSISIDYGGGSVIIQHISFRNDTLVMKNQFGEVSYHVPVK